MDTLSLRLSFWKNAYLEEIVNVPIDTIAEIIARTDTIWTDEIYDRRGAAERWKEWHKEGQILFVDDRAVAYSINGKDFHWFTCTPLTFTVRQYPHWVLNLINKVKYAEAVIKWELCKIPAMRLIFR